MPSPLDSEGESKDWSEIKMKRSNYPKVELKPFITLAKRTEDPDDLPSNYGVIIDIASVAHLQSKETPDKEYCAVLLHLTFNLDDVLDMADLPFEVVLIAADERATPRKLSKWWNSFNWWKSPKLLEEERLHLDVPFWFPNRAEMVPTGSYTATQTQEMKPKIAVPTPMGALAFGGVGTTKETSHTKDALISRWGAREYNSDKLVKLRWCFKNSGSAYYPISHSLIILIGTEARVDPRPYTFRLSLLKSLKVKSRSTSFGSRGAPGWEFHINGTYHPAKVDNMLQAYKEKTSDYEDITLAKLAYSPLVMRDSAFEEAVTVPYRYEVRNQ